MPEPSACLLALPGDDRAHTLADDAGDSRFQTLVPPAAWSSLPRDVRRRFAKRLGPGETAVYTGRVTRCVLNGPGRILAQTLRLIGAPLPLSASAGGVTVVTVSSDVASGGQTWTRIYCGERGLPQVIRSVKQFCGPTGLEERIGFGIAMNLKVGVEDGALVFSSAGYSVGVAGHVWRLPRWLHPGETIVVHRATGAGAFLFSMTLRHALFGILVHQEALYRDST